MAKSFRNPKIYVTTPPQTPYDVWQRRRRIAAAIFVVVFTVGLLWLLFFSSVFAVQDILVEGNLPPDVHSRFDQFKGKNIFRLDSQLLEQELKAEFPHVKAIAIYRGLPNALKVEIVEREAAVIWQTGSQQYFVDHEGVPFEETFAVPTSILDPGSEAVTGGEEGLPKQPVIPTIVDTQGLPVKLGVQILSSEFVSFVVEVAANTPPLAGIQVTEFQIGESTFQVEAVTDRTFSVIFDTTRRADRQLLALKKLLEGYKEPISEYVDLRVVGKAYVK